MKPERQKEKQEWARQKIVEAARELAARQGVSALTARQVAERAGISPSVLYYYFDNIQKITEAACRQAGEEAAAAVEGAIEPAGSFAENFLAAWKALLRLAWERPGEYRMLSSLAREQGESRALELLAKELERELEGGAICSAKVRDLAEDLWTAVQALICRLIAWEETLEGAEKRLEEFLKLLLRGLKMGGNYENIGD